MAPDKKRSHSPTNPPAWLSQLLRDNQLVNEDFRRQETALRELRLMTMENQLLLRDILQATNHRNSTRSLSINPSLPMRASRGPASSNSVLGNDAQRNLVSQNSTANPSNSRAVRQRPPSTSRSGVLPVPNRLPVQQAIAAQNAAVRQAAVPIPRASIPAQQAASKICWFHRQFGQTSAKCLQPCSFVAPTRCVQPAHNPVVPQANPAPVEEMIKNSCAPTNHISQEVEESNQLPSVSPPTEHLSSVTLRTPLERTVASLSTLAPAKRLSESSSSSDQSPDQPSTSKNFKPANWSKKIRRTRVHLPRHRTPIRTIKLIKNVSNQYNREVFK